MSTISIEELKDALRYDPDTGDLIWRHRKDRNNAWNAKHAGKQAGAITDNRVQILPYARWSIGFNRKRLFTHRVIWALFYGQWPVGEIDHINGDPSDNRIDNLRDVTRQENSRNQCVKSNNKTGVIGVHFDAQTKRWGAGITVSGKYIRLGRFLNFFDAVSVRKSAEARYGFHRNHGRMPVHAQQESQDLARQSANHIAPLFPVSWAALMENDDG